MLTGVAAACALDVTVAPALTAKTTATAPINCVQLPRATLMWASLVTTETVIIQFSLLPHENANAMRSGHARRTGAGWRRARARYSRRNRGAELRKAATEPAAGAAAPSPARDC